jgi:HD-GYP domain-containing protein (c-di-GMP phosphodiesterase class II)
LIDHRDALQELNSKLPIAEKLAAIHQVINTQYPGISRLATAIHDSITDEIQLLAISGNSSETTLRQAIKVGEISALSDILSHGKGQVIEDHELFSEQGNKVIADANGASYTFPILHNEVFYGFVFFSAAEQSYFKAEALHQLDVFGHLVSLLFVNEIQIINTLRASVRTIQQITHQRDPETGDHLERMSHYARLIAETLADRYQLNEDLIEHIFLFATLHDIGKISVPDHILMKRGKLSEEEYQQIRSHPSKGREIIDLLETNFGRDIFAHIDLLRNIVEYHHEAVNGNGYPYGMEGVEIPIESRIVAVADVFDALTSDRPYKVAWSNEDAFRKIRSLSATQLDHDCVEALISNRDRILEIQKKFEQNPYG